MQIPGLTLAAGIKLPLRFAGYEAGPDPGRDSIGWSGYCDWEWIIPTGGPVRGSMLRCCMTESYMIYGCLKESW